MTVDKLIRLWFPEAADAERIARMRYVAGTFINCRYHTPPVNGTFTCSKKNISRINCNGCRTCPNCDGRLAFYRRSVAHKQDGTHMTESYTCVHCGAYIEHETFKQKPHQPKDDRKAGKCEVEGCSCTAYEGHTHQEDSSQRKWLICEGHYRKVKTWRYNAEKGPEHTPIIVEAGKLKENPAYRKRQARK